MNTEQGAERVVTFDWTTYESPSTAVISAVAAEADVDPTTIEPLYTVVDPDALDAVIARPTGPRSSPEASVGFAYHDYYVLVEANGRGHLYDEDVSLRSLGTLLPETAANRAD